MITDRDRDRVHSRRRTERYLRALARSLADAPADAREAALEDVRAHIADALGEGRDVDGTLGALGQVDVVARQYRDELGLPMDPGVSEARAAAVMHWANVLTGALTGVFVAFLLPAYSAVSETETSSTEGGEAISGVETAVSTLVAENGPGAAVLALIPMLLAVLPLVLPRAARLPMAIGNALAVTLLCAVAGFTVGMFYVPLAVMMWAAVIVAARPRRRVSGRRRIGPRLLGSAVVAAPGLLILGGSISGAVRLDWVALAMALFALGLAAGFAFGIPWVSLVTAAVGALMMVLTLFDAGLLLLATWWIGGVYLAIGLAAFMSRRRDGRVSTSLVVR